MTTVTDYTQTLPTQSPLPQNIQPSNTVKELMKATLFTKGADGLNFHEKAFKFPFFMRLKDKSITPECFLQNLVNNQLIYGKVESIISTIPAFQQIWAQDLYRKPCLVQDIEFMTTHFKLAVPTPTVEATHAIAYIEEIYKNEPELLLAVIYVAYAGLMEGRVEYHDTVSWLKTHIKNYDQLPAEKRGVSFWRYRDVPMQENAKDIKAHFVKQINMYGADLKHKNPEKALKLPQTALACFNLMLKTVETSTPPLEIKAKVFQFTEPPPSTNVIRISRIFLLVIISCMIYHMLPKAAK